MRVSDSPGGELLICRTGRVTKKRRSQPRPYGRRGGLLLFACIELPKDSGAMPKGIPSIIECRSGIIERVEDSDQASSVAAENKKLMAGAGAVAQSEPAARAESRFLSARKARDWR
ncbi:hypothetical protein ACFVVQ_22265 [Paenibacillus chitinolyticus]|uniref:hypothetical protein n=1 Tax=Paenibacillus chitinolyticus TaxID=79263 RepID=UPI0036DBA9B8